MTKKIVTQDGTVMYYQNGKLHNYEGAALIPQGDKKKAEYYLFGVKFTKDKWEQSKKDSNGVPFAKTALGRKCGRV
ncbi:MAG TPA: hypothetical protein VFV86_06975 [Nitrososphaeraceae archaeon]|nr:hypothetical protein [Nitrososphaeraceae archaeon]